MQFVLLTPAESVLIASGPIVEHDFLGFSDLGLILDCFLQSLPPLDFCPLLLGVVAVVGVTQPLERLLWVSGIICSIFALRDGDGGVLERIRIWRNTQGHTLGMVLQVPGCMIAPQSPRIVGQADCAPGLLGVGALFVVKEVTTDDVQALLQLIVQTAFDTQVYGG